MDIRVRPVTLETRHAFAALLDEAGAWQRARGGEAWASRFDDAWMLPRIARGELFLVHLGPVPVATFHILWHDRPCWGDREVGDSLYLHTFAVRRDKAGLGVGRAAIETVVGLGRERGRDKVRLDCFLSSARLIAYYARNGFASVGTTSVNGRALNLMERII
ncbi:hypothetical protein OPKNFCMD_1007 [Methylobacterium crusticola]|uniref:N-acetyltransferase domain-containing protein n=1 Tax=Methylobacterium crusticola TaxID=1697972 RepID=A0ABQ4QTR1_9HYPH|nr:GNAT family N-acetyltransferase [Methylobacterium crusticola]GJD48290.1 hypothetical protein OPKNFCMD_1007 [Methylobacterium crusticola]